MVETLWITSHLSGLQWTNWWEDTRGIICWNGEEEKEKEIGNSKVWTVNWKISILNLNEKEKEIGNSEVWMVNWEFRLRADFFF